MSTFNKRHWTSWRYAAVCVLFLNASAALAETTLEKIKRTGVMTSANTFSYPPFGLLTVENRSALMSISEMRLRAEWV
jgi:hypothetical protein